MFLTAAAKLSLLRSVRPEYHADVSTFDVTTGQLYVRTSNASTSRTRLPTMRRRVSCTHKILRPLRRAIELSFFSA